MREWLAQAGEPSAVERAILSEGRDRPRAWRDLLAKYVRASIPDAEGYFRNRPDAGRIAAYLDDQRMSSLLAARPAEQNPWLMWVPGLRCQPVWERDQFVAAVRIKEAFSDILEEMKSGPRDAPAASAIDFEIYPNNALYAGDWSIYRLIDYGRDSGPGDLRMPKTAKLLRSLGVTVSVLSAMKPDAHIKPHCSTTNIRLVCHLGLVITEACTLRVGDRRLTWRDGETFVFDDSIVHEAWNDGSGRRIILIATLPHPDLSDFEHRFFLRLIHEVSPWYGEPPDGNAMPGEPSYR